MMVEMEWQWSLETFTARVADGSSHGSREGPAAWSSPCVMASVRAMHRI